MNLFESAEYFESSTVLRNIGIPEVIGLTQTLKGIDGVIYAIILNY